MLSVLGSFFICSFSGVLSAVILVFFSLFSLGILYWNMMSTVPLFIFSLFMLGGLFVLIGFVMMADSHDSDMILSLAKLKEFLWGFLTMFFSFSLMKFSGVEISWGFDFSPMKMYDWSSFESLSGTYLFLIFFLLVFLFVLQSFLKESWGKGGFVV